MSFPLFGLENLMQEAALLDEFRAAEKRRQQLHKEKERKDSNPFENLRTQVTGIVQLLLQNVSEIELNLLGMEAAGQIPAQCKVGVNVTKRVDAMVEQINKLCDLVELERPEPRPQLPLFAVRQPVPKRQVAPTQRANTSRSSFNLLESLLGPSTFDDVMRREVEIARQEKEREEFRKVLNAYSMMPPTSVPASQPKPQVEVPKPKTDVIEFDVDMSKDVATSIAKTGLNFIDAMSEQVTDPVIKSIFGALREEGLDILNTIPKKDEETSKENETPKDDESSHSSDNYSSDEDEEKKENDSCGHNGCGCGPVPRQNADTTWDSDDDYAPTQKQFTDIIDVLMRGLINPPVKTEDKEPSPVPEPEPKVPEVDETGIETEDVVINIGNDYEVVSDKSSVKNSDTEDSDDELLRVVKAPVPNSELTAAAVAQAYSCDTDSDEEIY